MINLHTKFEVSMFTHYENMKGNGKCGIWGCLKGQSSPKVTDTDTIQ